jgi:hypothetical protein
MGHPWRDVYRVSLLFIEDKGAAMAEALRLPSQIEHIAEDHAPGAPHDDGMLVGLSLVR